MLTTALATYALATAWAAPEPDEPYPAELDLQWTVPAGCPSEDEVRGRIEALLTGPPRGDGVMRVTGSVTEDPDGFRLLLATDFDGRTEERELSADACAELGEATAILLAFALEPDLAESESEPEPESNPATIPEPTTPEPTLPMSEHHEPSPPSGEVEATPMPPTSARKPVPITLPRPSFFFRLGGAVELGALPLVSGGPRAALGIGWRRVRIDLHGAYLAPRLEPASGPGAAYQAGMVGLRACALPAVGEVVTLPVCAGLEAGAVRAATRGFDPSRTRHGPWLGPLASVGVAARFGRFGLWSALEAVVPAYSGEFRILDMVGHTSAPVSGRFAIGAELIVP